MAQALGGYPCPGWGGSVARPVHGHKDQGCRDRQPKPGTSRPPRLRPVIPMVATAVVDRSASRHVFPGSYPAPDRLGVAWEALFSNDCASIAVVGRGHRGPLVPGHGSRRPGPRPQAKAEAAEGGPGAKAPSLHLKSPPGWVRPFARLRRVRVGAGLWPDRPGRLAVKEGARRLKPQATSEKPSGLGQAFRKVAPCSGRGGSPARPAWPPCGQGGGQAAKAAGNI
jgi:hypothetical protein